MLHNSPQWNLFLSPDDAVGSSSDASGTGEEVHVEDPDIDEEESEESEEETEDSSEDEETEELSRVEFKDVKAKYPQFFKDFPSLREAFFREQKITEIFPSIEDAQKAAEIQSAYEEITTAVVEGDANKFLLELETESKDGLKKFASNFLPALQEINKDLYFELVSEPVQKFIKNVYNIGIRDKDDNVKNAAKVVHKIIFGGGWEDVAVDMPQQNNRSKEIEEDKQKYMAGKYGELYKEVHGVCNGKLDEEINRGLSDLAKGRPGLQKMIAKEVKEAVFLAMEKDSNYMGRINGIWLREKRGGFNGTYKNNLVSTFMAKAKALIPKLRAEARKEALGKEDRVEEKEPNRLSGDKQRSSGSSKKMTPERARAEKLTTRQIFDM